MGLRTWLALVTALLLASAILPAHAGVDGIEGCSHSEAVLSSTLDSTEEWRLPLSVDRPDIITHARIGVHLQPPKAASGQWTADLKASFPDPKPFGIPYTYEKFLIKWSSPEGTGAAILDWSSECSNPGRSLFPGQEWSEQWEVPGTQGIHNLGRIDVYLWGSRN